MALAEMIKQEILSVAFQPDSNCHTIIAAIRAAGASISAVLRWVYRIIMVRLECFSSFDNTSHDTPSPHHGGAGIHTHCLRAFAVVGR